MEGKGEQVSRYEIILPVGPRKGCGWCGKKNRFYSSYKVNGRIERIFNDCKTREEAEAERDRLFTRLCMSQGAKRKGEKPKKAPRPPKDKMDPDFGIYPMVITRTDYKVILERKYFGTFRSKGAARKRRDDVLEAKHLNPCALCGERPLFTRDRLYHWTLEHPAPCPNAVLLNRRAPYRELTKDDKLALWNTKLYNRTP